MVTATIEKLEAVPVSVPFNTDFEVAGGGTEAPEHVLVRLHTTEGVGLGEAAPKPFFSSETCQSVLGAIDRLEDALIGVDATNLNRVHRTMSGTLKGNPFAKTAIDTACHDVWGRTLGVPVSVLLGGRVREEISVGQSIGIKPTEEAVADAERYVYEEGFSSIKVKVGDPAEQAAERVRAVADAVGDDVPLRVDANQGYTVDVAVPLFSRLEREVDLLVVEQPVGRDDREGLKSVTAALETPVLADESVFSPADAFSVAATRSADAINIKLMKAGGLRPAARIGDVAAAADLRVAVGSMVELGVGTAAGAHLAATLPNLGYPSDVKGPSLFADTVLRNPLDIADGGTPVPDGPGLGVDLDADQIDRYRVDRP